MDDVNAPLLAEFLYAAREAGAVEDVPGFPVFGKADHSRSNLSAAKRLSEETIPAHHYIGCYGDRACLQSAQEVQQALLRATDARVVLQVEHLQGRAPSFPGDRSLSASSHESRNIDSSCELCNRTEMERPVI